MTGPGSRFLSALHLPVQQRTSYTELSEPLRAELPDKSARPQTRRTLTRTPRRLAVWLGSRGAAVKDGEGLVVLDARNLALLLRQEGRGRVFFAGHPVPQSGAAGSAGRGAERI